MRHSAREGARSQDVPDVVPDDYTMRGDDFVELVGDAAQAANAHCLIALGAMRCHELGLVVGRGAVEHCSC